MSDAKKYSGKSKTAGGESELRFVGVEFKPAPDAQDRLRRLFTILAAHFAEREPVEEKQDRLAGGQSTDDDDRGAE